jgi:methylamine dehydrogenase accessory protein MauD
MTALMISNVLLWIVNIAVVVTVLALARQIGVLLERITPVGALTMDHGPKVGEAAPVFTLPTLGGGEIVIGAATGRSQLLFFLSPTCPGVQETAADPALDQPARAATVDVVLASDGEVEEHSRLLSAREAGPFPYVLSAISA